MIPRLVNAAGRIEVTLDRAARLAGVRPSLLIAGAAIVLTIAGVRVRARPGRSLAPQ